MSGRCHTAYPQCEPVKPEAKDALLVFSELDTMLHKDYSQTLISWDPMIDRYVMLRSSFTKGSYTFHSIIRVFDSDDSAGAYMDQIEKKDKEFTGNFA